MGGGSNFLKEMGSGRIGHNERPLLLLPAIDILFRVQPIITTPSPIVPDLSQKQVVEDRFCLILNKLGQCLVHSFQGEQFNHTEIDLRQLCTLVATLQQFSQQYVT